MGKKKSLLSWALIIIGAILFLGGFYLLPVGTDIYLYFWIEIVEKGNWLYGDILANAVAVLAMVVGGLILWYEHKAPWQGKKKSMRKFKKEMMRL